MNAIFHFQATAAAASGTITAPFHEQIEVAAASTLPPGGGYGSARVNDFRHREILSFKEAYSYVTGSHSEANGTFRTSATAVVVGLNILDVVTADRIVARLSSRKYDIGKEKEKEAEIILLGSRFENLRIAGRLVGGVDPLPTKLFSDFSTLDKLTGKDKTNESPDARKQLGDHLFSVLRRERKHQVDKHLQKFLPKKDGGEDIGLRASNGVLSCSLAPDLEDKVPEHKTIGHAIYVEQFGVIRLAELQISGGERRLTMLSVDLGCPFEGNLSLCFAGSNGSIWT